MADKLDRAESAFRHAERAQYLPKDFRIERIAVVTDREGSDAHAALSKIQTWISPVPVDDSSEWLLVPGESWSNVPSLLEKMEALQPDLVIANRYMRSATFKPEHSLGVVVDVLTQAQPAPVLVLPGENRDLPELKDILAMTDHLTGDDQLVDWSAALTPPDGTLTLVHVEDESTFDRYIEAFKRMPDLDTEVTMVALKKELLHEPKRYVDSTVEVLSKVKPGIEVSGIVEMGQTVASSKRIIEAMDIDLLVMKTRSAGQLAMSGTSYALAVELSDIPLLLL